MLLLFPFCLALGFFVPGYFLAKSLRNEFWAPTAFVLSLLVLFYSVFWLGVFHVQIGMWSVLSCLVVASLAAARLKSQFFTHEVAKTEPAAGIGAAERILVASSGLVGLTLLVRSAVSPLIGYDTQFRWDLLAQRIL